MAGEDHRALREGPKGSPRDQARVVRANRSESSAQEKDAARANHLLGLGRRIEILPPDRPSRRWRNAPYGDGRLRIQRRNQMKISYDERSRGRCISFGDPSRYRVSREIA